MPKESSNSRPSVEKSRSTETIVDLADRNEPTMSVIDAIADAANQSVLDLTPLAESIDPEALDRLFAECASGRLPDLSVTFTHAGSTVTVTGAGDVRVTPA